MTPIKALYTPPNIPVNVPIKPLTAGHKAIVISPAPCSNMNTIANNSTTPGGITLKKD